MLSQVCCCYCNALWKQQIFLAEMAMWDPKSPFKGKWLLCTPFPDVLHQETMRWWRNWRRTLIKHLVHNKQKGRRWSNQHTQVTLGVPLTQLVNTSNISWVAFMSTLPKALSHMRYYEGIWWACHPQVCGLPQACTGHNELFYVNYFYLKLLSYAHKVKTNAHTRAFLT